VCKKIGDLIMPVTVKDVAKLAGVSAATVSRVINNDPRISAKTCEKVFECIKKLGYQTNSIARSLKTSKTCTVGFLCPDLPNDFFMSIAKGVENELRKYGYSVIICNSNGNINEESERIKLLLSKCVDGIIIIPSSNEGEHFNIIKNMDIPVVLVDRLVENFTTDAVLVDNVNGSYSAIEHIIVAGYRRIAFIGGDMRLTTAKERYEGYIRALKDYCIEIDDEIIRFGDFSVESGYSLMKEILDLPECPEYVFISNYYMHVGATKYLVENCRNCNISIASYDDMELSSILGFCKVLVRQPMTEIGSIAVKILISRIEDDKTNFPQIVRLKNQIVCK
jgi:LacI family transcriptional regulator